MSLLRHIRGALDMRRKAPARQTGEIDTHGLRRAAYRAAVAGAAG